MGKAGAYALQGIGGIFVSELRQLFKCYWASNFYGKADVERHRLFTSFLIRH